MCYNMRVTCAFALAADRQRLYGETLALKEACSHEEPATNGHDHRKREGHALRVRGVRDPDLRESGSCSHALVGRGLVRYGDLRKHSPMPNYNQI